MRSSGEVGEVMVVDP